MYRLKQFILMLHKDIEASSHAATPKRDDMRSKMGYLNDRYTFNTMLVGNSGDELFKAVLTALMLMMNPDALEKESDVFKAAALWISPMKRDHWDKFYANVRDGGRDQRGSHQEGGLGQGEESRDHIGQNAKGHRFRAGHQLTLYLCEWVVAASAITNSAPRWSRPSTTRCEKLSQRRRSSTT